MVACLKQEVRMLEIIFIKTKKSATGIDHKGIHTILVKML